MGDVSEHFSYSEFQCKGKQCCGGAGAVSPDLVVALERLRNTWGRRLLVTSGYRCAKHNEQVGGAPNSQHLLGLAVDVVPAGWNSGEGLARDVRRLAGLALRIGSFVNGGIGIYPGWLHLDIRGKPARWEG